MSQLSPTQQRTLQMALYDLMELDRELQAAGVSLVVTTHPLPSSDRFMAAVHGAEVERFTWNKP